MATRDDILSADLDSMVADFPVTFKWGLECYTGHLTTNAARADLEFGGVLKEFDLTIYTSKAQFGCDRPKVGDLIEVNGRTLRVESVEEIPDDIGFQIHLTGKDK